MLGEGLVVINLLLFLSAATLFQSQCLNYPKLKLKVVKIQSSSWPASMCQSQIPVCVCVCVCVCVRCGVWILGCKSLTCDL